MQESNTIQSIFLICCIFFFAMFNNHLKPSELNEHVNFIEINIRKTERKR